MTCFIVVKVGCAQDEDIILPSQDLGYINPI